VPLERIPRVLQDAVIAIEDRRFWQHKGVDVRAVLRAAVTNGSEGKVVEGGSTITQQYVKNEILTSDRTLHRKVKEATLAYQLEKSYSKKQILELYLNSIYFGNGAYGVDAAARDYFGVPVEKVTLDQAALLAGVIRSPTATDPVAHPEEAVARRNVVLRAMADQHAITQAQAAAAAAVPLQLRDRSTDERYAAPHFVERVKRFVLDDPRFGPTPAARRRTLFQGGLRISTTLDPAMQAQAEAAVAKVLSAPDRDPSAAVVSIEPKTGYVRALVGGRTFFTGGDQGKFDLATQGRRPAGSSFKPIVLAAAIDQGIPLTKVYDAPTQIDIPLPRSTWRVQNYEGHGGGQLNLVDATVQSVNTVYAQLILEVGPDRAVQVAASLGITSPLQALPSAVLGTNDVSPLDMATAYSTFANRGVLVPPTFVTKVVGPDGTVLYQHQHSQKRVLPTETVDALTGVLTQVVERGTGTGARLGRPVAGKTGTGQEWRDAWFVGFTPQLATAVWVGFPDAQRSMVPPATRIRVTGGSWPAQIWQLLMSAALAQQPVEDFPPPPPLVGADGAPVPQPARPVPDVVGMPVEEAEAMLTREGFLASRHLVPSDDYPPGRVIAQNPRGEAPGGSTIVLEVSNGPVPRRAVPSVLGLTQAEAVKKLEAAGFTAQVVHEAEPPTPGSASRKGKVWKQSPGSGSAAPAGSSVTIWINPK
jgi:penicillin-binding protein 1A